MLRDTINDLSQVLPADISVTEQRKHRIEILKSWSDVSLKAGYDLDSAVVGQKSMDIGCGQGDMIEMFAATLAQDSVPASQILGIDPGSLDYGAPFTLGEAQSALKKGPFGACLDFHQASAPEYLASQPFGTIQTAYLAHSLYYFPSAAAIQETFAALRQSGVKTLLLAEWDLSISHPEALPHLLATLLQTVSPLPEGNIRTVLGGDAYIGLAERAGWKLVGKQTIQPGPGLEDGKWETRIALEIARKATETAKQGHIQVKDLQAHETALQRSVAGLKNVDAIRSMDVFTAVLHLAEG